MSMSLKKKVRELTGDDATQASQIQTLQADVGTDDTTAGGLKKRCKTIETAIGDNTTGEETGIYKDIADLVAAIGDEDTAASILGRIKALEDKQPSGTE